MRKTKISGRSAAKVVAVEPLIDSHKKAQKAQKLGTNMEDFWGSIVFLTADYSDGLKFLEAGLVFNHETHKLHESGRERSGGESTNGTSGGDGLGTGSGRHKFTSLHCV